MMSQIRLLIIF